MQGLEGEFGMVVCDHLDGQAPSRGFLDKGAGRWIYMGLQRDRFNKGDTVELAIAHHDGNGLPSVPILVADLRNPTQ